MLFGNFFFILVAVMVPLEISFKTSSDLYTIILGSVACSILYINIYVELLKQWPGENYCGDLRIQRTLH